jgi:hypothetical protein
LWYVTIFNSPSLATRSFSSRCRSAIAFTNFFAFSRYSSALGGSAVMIARASVAAMRCAFAGESW